MSVNKVENKSFTKQLPSKSNFSTLNTNQKVSSSEEIKLSQLFKNCHIEQVSTSCMAHFGYYIEADGNAIIIDPIRDVEFYMNLLKKRGAKLKYVGETHFHADFVSGHYELSQNTGAPIVFGPGAKADYHILNTSQEMILDLSENIKIQILHTPGHTLESCCFAVLEKVGDSFKKIAVATGDTVFLGEIGRPDLAVKSDLSARDLGAMLYDSIQYLKRVLPDDCLILPGHGAGSACGKNIQSGLFCSVGKQKLSNYALKDDLKKDEFIEIVLSNMPEPPQYFFYDAALNRKILSSVNSIIKDSNKPISISNFKELTKDPSVKIIDSRSNKLIYHGIIPGSYCIDLKMTYAIWTATLFKPTDKIIIVAEPGKEEESITRLIRVGFENVVGYLEGGYEAWTKNGNKAGIVNNKHVKDSLQVVKEDFHFVLDVRNKEELINVGTIKKYQHIPLSKLESQISQIKNDSNPIYILCKTGMRASIAASILIKHNFKSEIYVLEGGMDSLLKNGFQPLKL